MNDMLVFFRTLKAEFIKTRRTYGLLVSVLIPILISSLQFMVFYFKHEYFSKTGMNPWETLGMNFFNAMGILIMPMYLVLLAYLINFTEHRSNSWKYLFSLPVPKLYVYSAKIMVVMVWVTVFVIISSITFFGIGYSIMQIYPEVGFQDFNINQLIIKSFIKLYASAFGILSVQFLFSIYWKDFIRPVGIGFALVIISLILNSWEYIYLVPYSHAYSVASDFMGQSETIFTKSVVLSLVYAVLFFISGFMLVSRQEVK